MAHDVCDELVGEQFGDFAESVEFPGLQRGTEKCSG